MIQQEVRQEFPRCGLVCASLEKLQHGHDLRKYEALAECSSNRISSQKFLHVDDRWQRRKWLEFLSSSLNHRKEFLRDLRIPLCICYPAVIGSRTLLEICHYVVSAYIPLELFRVTQRFDQFSRYSRLLVRPKPSL